jgi:hypothetical protein
LKLKQKRRKMMRKPVLTVCIAVVLSFGVAAATLARAGHEEHHPQAAGEPTVSPQSMEMMRMGGMGTKGGMEGMMCPMCAQMMAGGMMAEREGMDERGGMGMMDRPFFLDRVKELGLGDEQVSKLKEVRQAARADNIRTAAELRIARLELLDLLAGEWKLETAEKLVRDMQKMQGDMKIRFLKAKKEAEQVLTPEQLKVARGGEEELEGLFR